MPKKRVLCVHVVHAAQSFTLAPVLADEAGKREERCPLTEAEVEKSRSKSSCVANSSTMEGSPVQDGRASILHSLALDTQGGTQHIAGAQ